MTLRSFSLFALACVAFAGACGSAKQPEGSDQLNQAVSNVGKPKATSGSGNTVYRIKSAGTASNSSGVGTQALSYYGGPVISNVKVVQVNWNGNVDPTIMNGMGGFYSALTKSELIGWLDTDYATNINANVGSHSGQAGTNQHIGRGSFAGSYTLSQTQTTITDSLIQTVLAANIGTGALPAPDANTVYMIQFPPHTSITDAFGEQSCSIFCAYHSTLTIGGQAVKYGVLPDMSVDCNLPNPFGAGTVCGPDPSYFNNGTMAASHELVEAITDPNVGLETTLPTSYDYPGAWGGNYGEIGDICNQLPGTIKAHQPNGTRYVVQEEYDNKSGQCIVSKPAGDINADGLSDYALTGGSGWNTVPVAFSNTLGSPNTSPLQGTFYITNTMVTNFPSDAASPGAKAVPGDFDGDGRSDIALVGGQGWGYIEVAFSNGDGSFRDSQQTVVNFPGWASSSGVMAVAGDFDGDGLSDIALTGGPNWWSVPVAFSNGDGTFRVANWQFPDCSSNPSNCFPGWAQNSGAKAVAGDFDGDGRSDIALTGGAWQSIPVAFSNGDGSFRVQNLQDPACPSNPNNCFEGWAQQSGATPIAGDFDGDGRGDIALTAGAGWGTIPVAFSNGDGSFRVTNTGVNGFPQDAAAAVNRPVPGDFNGDGLGDICLAVNTSGSANGYGWISGEYYCVFSNGDGSFNFTGYYTQSSFPQWATPPVKSVGAY